MTYIVQYQEPDGHWRDRSMFGTKEEAFYLLIELDSDEREDCRSRRIVFSGPIREVVIAYGRHHQPELKKEKGIPFYFVVSMREVHTTITHDDLSVAIAEARKHITEGRPCYVMKAVCKVDWTIEEYKE